jgi:hypothetical protein
MDLQTLPCPTEGQITDHYINQRKMHKFLFNWHAIPATLDPAADRLARHPTWSSTLLHYEAVIHEDLDLHTDSAIPLDIQKGLRNMCSAKVSPELADIIQEAIYADITYEHFNETLMKSLKTGSAPGPSQVTANMIKAGPGSTQQFVYRHMANVWKTRTIPSWVRDNLIKPCPNVAGNSDMDNIQPISLYEIIRKV